MRNIIVTLATLTLVAVTASAEAAPRKPLRHVDERTSTLSVEPSKGYTELVQERSEMTKRAVFHAEPQTIDENGVMLFQAFGVSSEGSSVERWRCVATHDIAECLGAAVRIDYKNGEEKMVLRMTMRHRETEEGGKLIAEAKLRNHETMLADTKK